MRSAEKLFPKYFGVHSPCRLQYRERIIFLGQALDEELGNQLVGTMLYLDSENHKDMRLYINCAGGDVSCQTPCCEAARQSILFEKIDGLVRAWYPATTHASSSWAFHVCKMRLLLPLYTAINCWMEVPSW